MFYFFCSYKIFLGVDIYSSFDFLEVFIFSQIREVLKRFFLLFVNCYLYLVENKYYVKVVYFGVGYFGLLEDRKELEKK